MCPIVPIVVKKDVNHIDTLEHNRRNFKNKCIKSCILLTRIKTLL